MKRPALRPVKGEEILPAPVVGDRRKNGWFQSALDWWSPSRIHRSFLAPCSVLSAHRLVQGASANDAALHDQRGLSRIQSRMPPCSRDRNLWLPWQYKPVAIAAYFVVMGVDAFVALAI